jgi:hypothetical protein
MGTAQLSFAEDRTIVHDRKWRDRKWHQSHDRKWRESHVRKYVLRMRNRKLRHIHPSMAFWPEVTKSRVRKRPCLEAVIIGSRFCACPDFPRAFFLVVVTWLPDVIEGHLTLLRGSLGFRMRNRKLRNTCSDRMSRDPLEVSLGCSLRRPRLIFSMVTGTKHPRLIFLKKIFLHF